MPYTRYNRFTATNIDSNTKLILICSNYDYDLNHSATEYELPNGTIISDVLLKREYDKNIPIGRQLADSFDFKINTLELLDNSNQDILHWITKNGTDNVDFWNGTTEYEDMKKVVDLQYLPNIWIIQRDGVNEYIGVQLANPENKIVLNNDTCEREIKTLSIYKFIMERVYAQFWNADYFDNKPTWVNKLFYPLDYVLDFKPMKIVDLYKNYDGKNRHAYNYCRDGNHSYIYGKVTDLMVLMQKGYNTVARYMLREIMNFSNNIVIPNPLLEFDYFENPMSGNNSGAMLDINNVLINIGTVKADPLAFLYGGFIYDLPLQTKYKNLWNFALTFYDSYATRLIFDYQTCGFRIARIIDNDTPTEILDLDILPGNITISELADSYNTVQIRSFSIANEVNNFENLIGFTDAGAKFTSEMLANNILNKASISEGFAPDIKRNWNYYDSKNYKSFPLYKIFYYDSNLANNSDFAPGMIKVSQIVGFGSATCPNPTVDFTTANNLEDWNKLVAKMSVACTAQFVSNIYKDYLFNKKIYGIEILLPIEVVKSSHFGTQFHYDATTLAHKSGFENIGTNWVLSNVEYNYSKNEAKCTFFIRGDEYAV